MANDDDEVFDFTSDQFSKTDLIDALNDMVVEYRNLSEKFSDLQTRNKILSASKTETVIIEKGQKSDQNIFKIENSELCTENSKLKNIILTNENEIKRLNFIISSWTDSSIALKHMLGEQRPAKSKFGLGFVESMEPKSNLRVTQKSSIKFVKSTSFNPDEVTRDSQNFKNLYVQPDASKNSWLKPKNKTDNYFDKTKTKPKNDFKKNVLKKKEVTKAKPVETKIINGKSVKVIQVWIPKGLIFKGPM